MDGPKQMVEYDDELSKIVAELNRAAPSAKSSPVGTPMRIPQSTASLDQLLAAAAGRNASDVVMVVGAPVVLRINGALSLMSGPPLDADDVRALLLPLLEPGQMEELQKRKSVDLGFVRENLGRFRVNIHHQRGTLAASIRLLPSRIPSLESLHLPLSLAKLAERRQGLVLGHRTHRLRQKLDPRRADRPRQYAPRRARGHDRRSRRISAPQPQRRSSSRSKSAATRRISPSPCAASCVRPRT